MSEFTNTSQQRLEKLREVAEQLLKTGNARSFIINNKDFIPTVIPGDFIALFDEIIREGYKMEDVKVLSNKILNIFHIPLRDFKRIQPKPDTFLGVLEQNNHEMELLLDKIRPVFKAYVKHPDNASLRKELLELFLHLDIFIKHYTIKENVLFPVLEETWPDYRCVKIMWSFHDDIRRNIKAVIAHLNQGETNVRSFNRHVGDLFFNMLAIKFREERILFPYILSTISERKLDTMKCEASELGYPYIQTEINSIVKEKTDFDGDFIDLGTGKVSLEQIKLIFNHLPVDITFVDDNDKVCYFSTPPKRIFPRSKAVIGREVRNCHPPESVHIVERIVESFRNGKKDKADFWIKMRGEYILIQYFPVRDQHGNYKGVVEVSQEISGIKALEGEKRLLDW